MMNFLFGTAGKAMLIPGLRFMRDRLARDPDWRQFRVLGARVDALARAKGSTHRSEQVMIGELPATWIDVAGARKTRVILYLHGGAFIMETPALHGAMLARICRAAKARALMPHYRLAPEHPYPAPLDDCMTAYRFLLESGTAPENIVVAGDSAGGNLTLTLLLRARDEGLPMPAAAVALSPLTDGTLKSDSIQRNNGHDAMFRPNLFEAFAPLYVPDRALAQHPYVSPLYGDLAGLPPILMLVGSTELLLDDAVRFASKCPSVTLEVWHDMPHVFPAFDVLPEAGDAIQRIGRFVRERMSAPKSEAPEAGEADKELAPDVEQPSKTVESSWPLPALAFFALAALAALLALASLLPISVPGAAAPQALLAGLLPGVAWSGSVQLWIGTLALLAFAASSVARIGVRLVWLPVAATLLLGLPCGLALLLGLRARTE